MSALTTRQKQELNKAISLYLRPKLDPQLYKEINSRLNITEEDLKSSVDNNILEKKWSTVIRLQKKILDLENQVNNLNSLLDQSGSNLVNNSNKGILTKINWLPSRISQNLTAHKSSINSVDIHPFLPELVSGLNDGSIVIWDLLNPLQPIKAINAHTKAINEVCYSSKPLKLNNQNEGSILLATCSSDLYIKIWDVSHNYELVRTLSGHSHTISSIVFKKDNPGHLFSCSRDGQIILWDITNGWRLKSFVGHSDWVRSLDLSLNDEFLISCANDQSARLSHGNSGTGLSMMIGHTHVIEDCKFAPLSSWKYLDLLINNIDDENIKQQYQTLTFKYCATASRDETIKIWLLPLPIIRPHRDPMPNANPSAICIAELKGHSSWVRSLQFHPGGKYLFSSSDDKSIKIWDLSAIEKLGLIKCIRTLNNAHEGFINCIKFAKTIKFNNKQIQQEKQINEIKEIDSEKKKLNDLNKSIRTIFASGGTDNKVCLWN